MASRDTKLNIIVDAQDKTKQAFGSVNDNLARSKSRMDGIKSAAIGMAKAGVAAVTAFGVFGGFAVRSAGMAEGAYNKFNTVFAEHSDDMMEFVREIRKVMPTATSEIVRMAADLQDLLVPMGIARDEATEMSKGFLDLANKIAAFNDVDPTQVLEAFKSGLSGSSEPLRRFGINALESALEMEAFNTGLLKVGQGGFKDLDPMVRTQIRSQALLSLAFKQSSDAINGFAENNDSFVRRSQELKATLQEIKEQIGFALLPVIDDLLKKILPFVSETLPRWIDGMRSVKGSFSSLIESIEAKTGLISMLSDWWGALAFVFETRLKPALDELWVSLQPYRPILEYMAKAFGGILVVAIGATIMVLGTLAIALAEALTILSKIAVFINTKFVAAWDYIVDKVGSAILKVEKFIEVMSRAFEMVGGLPTKIGKGLGNLFNVDDAVISPNGNIISTHPEDYLIATKNPGALAAQVSGAGGGMTINITGNTFMSDEDAAETIGDMIMSKLKLSNAV